MKEMGELKKQGNQAFMQKDYEDALDLYEAALEVGSPFS